MAGAEAVGHSSTSFLTSAQPDRRQLPRWYRIPLSLVGLILLGHVMIQGLGHCTYQKHQRTRNHGPCDVMPRFILCWPASVSQRDTSRSRAPQLAESCRQAQAERSLKSFRDYSLFTVAAIVAKWFKLTRNRECRSWSLLSGAQRSWSSELWFVFGCN